MEDAPKRIWAYKWHQYETRNGPSQTEYVRADLYSDLLRAADVLADHVEAVAEWMIENGYEDTADKDALSAYNKAKETNK